MLIAAAVYLGLEGSEGHLQGWHDTLDQFVSAGYDMRSRRFDA